MKLYNDNCLNVLKKIPGGSINLVVTSPPYDQLREYEGKSTWNFEVFKNIANELKRVICKGGVIVWVVGDACVKGSETGTSFRQALYFKEIGLNLHDTMIYWKSGPPQNQRRYEQHFEYMFVLSKGYPKVFNAIKDKTNRWSGNKVSGAFRQKDGSVGPRATGKTIKKYGLRGNIWKYAAGYLQGTPDKIAYEHPATFPERLARDHIISWSNEGDTVLDPFMGSGTTGKQAVLLKRKFIGSEIVKSYFEIAEKRIRGVQ